MSRSSSISRTLLVSSLLGMAAFSGGSLSAQDRSEWMTRTHFGFGFTGNAPDAILGGSAYVVLPRFGGIGLYVDAKFDLENPTDERGYDPDVTVEEVEGVHGGDYVKSEASWRSFNVAIVRPVSSFLMVYGGGGAAFRTEYGLFNVSQTGGVGVGGLVWAEDPRQEETRVNLMAGLIMRLTSRVSTHFGFETQPRGLTIGASLRLPPW